MAEVWSPKGYNVLFPLPKIKETKLFCKLVVQAKGLLDNNCMFNSLFNIAFVDNTTLGKLELKNIYQ